jgi:hypothetical protein
MQLGDGGHVLVCSHVGWGELAAVTLAQCASSDVSRVVASVAVALTAVPGASADRAVEKLAFPLPSVVTLVDPR